MENGERGPKEESAKRDARIIATFVKEVMEYGLVSERSAVMLAMEWLDHKKREESAK